MTATTKVKEQYYLIENEAQYEKYIHILKKLLWENETETIEDTRRIDLLTIIIKEWEDKTYKLSNEKINPVQLLDYLIKENKLKQKELAEKLEIRSTLLNDVLHYRRKMSLEVVRSLASHFKMSQEAFNRPYELKPQPSVNFIHYDAEDHSLSLTTSVKINGKKEIITTSKVNGGDIIRIAKGSGVKVKGGATTYKVKGKIMREKTPEGSKRAKYRLHKKKS